MLLRLKQGIGRLIRSRDDSGLIVLLSTEINSDPELKDMIQQLLPKGVVLNVE